MDNLDYIDSYFGERFPPEEASRFEKRIQDDPAFAEEVSFYLATRVAYKEADVEERKAKFRQLYKEEAQVSEETRGPVVKRLNPRVVIGAAAAILVAVVLSWLFFQRPSDAPAIADRYIRQNLGNLPQKMGVEDRMQSGIALYNDGKLSDALQQFENLVRADSINPAALLAAGIVSLRLENYDKALDYFIKLQNHTDPRVNPALFYQALTLMKRNRAGDSDLAKQQLMRIVREDLNMKEDARELLGKL